MQKLLATIATIMGCGIVVLIAQTDGQTGMGLGDMAEGGGGEGFGAGSSAEGRKEMTAQNVYEQMAKAQAEGTLDSNFQLPVDAATQKAILEGQALLDAQAQGK